MGVVPPFQDRKLVEESMQQQLTELDAAVQEAIAQHTLAFTEGVPKWQKVADYYAQKLQQAQEMFDYDKGLQRLHDTVHEILALCKKYCSEGQTTPTVCSWCGCLHVRPRVHGRQFGGEGGLLRGILVAAPPACRSSTRSRVEGG